MEEPVFIPFSEINRLVDSVSERDLNMMEMQILSAFNWQMNRLTGAHFAGWLSRLSTLCHAADLSEVPFTKQSLFFANLAMQDAQVGPAITPSLIGLASVCSARWQLQLHPNVPTDLLSLTGHSFDEVSALVGHLHQYVLGFDRTERLADLSACVQDSFQGVRCCSEQGERFSLQPDHLGGGRAAGGDVSQYF